MGLLDVTFCATSLRAFPEDVGFGAACRSSVRSTLLMLDGEDQRNSARRERKRRLLDVMPRIESRVRFVDHVHETGVRFFELACDRDLEGIVGEYASGIYQADSAVTSRIKFKNLTYSQAEGRHELIEQRRSPESRPGHKLTAPTLILR